MSLSIRNLETLLWISRLGSFAQAAKRLRTTQPAVSMRIRELERYLGVKLLNRSRNKVRLTDKGRECVATAERIVALAANLKQRISEKKALSGNVRVGVSEAVALSWLPALVSRLNSDFPGIVVELEGLCPIGWCKFVRYSAGFA
jgi:DNA-binding transcriptional LysR family regulator